MTEYNKEILRKCFLFRKLPAQLQDIVFEELEVQHFGKGENIYTQHKFKKSLGIILGGEAAVYKEKDTLLNRLLPGSCTRNSAVPGPNSRIRSDRSKPTGLTPCSRW